MPDDFFVLTLLFTQTIFAQEKIFVVSGVVTEPNSSITIPYVTVQAFVSKETSNLSSACCDLCCRSQGLLEW